MAGGSILGAIAIGVATLFAVGALAWGAANPTATKHVATPVAAPQYLDRGGRELPVAGPKPYLPAAAANQWSMTGGSATGSTTYLTGAAPKSYLPAAAANQWSMTGGSATGSTTYLTGAAPKSYLPAASANQWSMTGGSATGSTTYLPVAAPKSYLPAASANQWSMTGS